MTTGRDLYSYIRAIEVLLVYAPRNSNRLYYILRTLLQDALGLEFRITQDKQEMASHQGPGICYAELCEGNFLHIKPHSILYDHGIRDYHLEVSNHELYHKVFFRNTGATLPFDLFGAAFWLLSRYEEYLPFKADKYGRFQYSSSLAYQYDFLHLPLVNFWLVKLSTELIRLFPNIKIHKRNYSFLSTIDVDNAYKYKHKGLVRTLAGILSDKSFKKTKQRFRIILGLSRDPFDNYDFLIQTHKNNKTQALFFFLVGDYGPNDKNHASSDLGFQSLIKHVADYSSVGLHPSFGSNNSLRQLKVELSRLANITHRIITNSRQHFSMLRFPKTYLDLLQAGLESDYSMGYTNKNGFRASYCYPYKWYMLDTESVSPLEIHPFCISEATLMREAQEQKLEPLELASPYVLEVKKYAGEMISIFHNDMLNSRVKKLYLDFIKLAG